MLVLEVWSSPQIRKLSEKPLRKEASYAHNRPSYSPQKTTGPHSHYPKVPRSEGLRPAAADPSVSQPLAIARQSFRRPRSMASVGDTEGTRAPTSPGRRGACTPVHSLTYQNAASDVLATPRSYAAWGPTKNQAPPTRTPPRDPQHFANPNLAPSRSPLTRTSAEQCLQPGSAPPGCPIRMRTQAEPASKSPDAIGCGRAMGGVAWVSCRLLKSPLFFRASLVWKQRWSRDSGSSGRRRRFCPSSKLGGRFDCQVMGEFCGVYLTFL